MIDELVYHSPAKIFSFFFPFALQTPKERKKERGYHCERGKTPASMGYLLSVFYKNSTLKPEEFYKDLKKFVLLSSKGLCGPQKNG